MTKLGKGNARMRMENNKMNWKEAKEMLEKWNDFCKYYAECLSFNNPVIFHRLQNITYQYSYSLIT